MNANHPIELNDEELDLVIGGGFATIPLGLQQAPEQMEIDPAA